jgi:hypothetical protein
MREGQLGRSGGGSNRTLTASVCRQLRPRAKFITLAETMTSQSGLAKLRTSRP